MQPEESAQLDASLLGGVSLPRMAWLAMSASSPGRSTAHFTLLLLPHLFPLQRVHVRPC